MKTLKSKFLIIILIASVSFAYSQSEGKKNYRRGGNGSGITAMYLNSKEKRTTLSSRRSIIYKAMSGFGLGYFTQRPLSQSFKLKVALAFNYVSRNADSFSSIILPIALKYYPGNSGFNLQAGIIPAYSLEILTANSDFNRVFISGIIGMGVDIDKILLAVRYNFGITNFEKFQFFGIDSSGNVITPPTDVAVKKNVISLSLSYIL